MGQSFYTCSKCGEPMGDYSHNIYYCDCGKVYCEDCADEVHFKDEDWYAENENDDCHESTCDFLHECRCDR